MIADCAGRLGGAEGAIGKCNRGKLGLVPYDVVGLPINTEVELWENGFPRIIV